MDDFSDTERAEAFFKNGANCCQSILCAFCERAGLTQEQALRLGAPFGGGLARQRELCGALTGICMIAGFLRGYTDTHDKEAKDKHYALIRQLTATFKEKNGFILCRDLLASAHQAVDTQGISSPRTPEYYAARPCAKIVASAATILDDVLNSEEP